MKKVILLFLCCVSFLFFCSSFFFVVFYHIQNNTKYNSKFFVKSDIINLGTVNSSDIVFHSFDIYNIGYSPLEIFSIKSSCIGCIEIIEISSTLIERNNSTRVRFSFDPKKLSGKVYRSFAIYTNDPTNQIIMIRITADVTEPTY